jgi:hypothetical protein
MKVSTVIVIFLIGGFSTPAWAAESPPSHPGTTTTSLVPLSSAQATQRLSLLERETGIWGAEATQAGTDVIPFSKSLPLLEAQVLSMRKEIAELSNKVQEAKATAEKAIIEQYVTGSSPGAPTLFSTFTGKSVTAAKQIYLGLVAREEENAVTSYEALKTRASRTQAIIQAHLKVITTTIPDLFLDATTLATDARTAHLQATTLSSSLKVPLRINATKALNIVGPTTLTATEMAAWWTSMGYQDNTGIGILQLAREYVKAGRAEGVAGDVAFAQSILETGGFSVMSGRNNFAGIGACNSCSGGYNYPTYIQGIRAQVQLLHAYSDKNLTSSQLVGGVAYQGVNTLSVKGCCISWVKLSAVWATGTHYGDIILGIYSKMLQYAVGHPTAG